MKKYLTKRNIGVIMLCMGLVPLITQAAWPILILVLALPIVLACMGVTLIMVGNIEERLNKGEKNESSKTV